MYNFALFSLDSTHGARVTWCDDVANSFAEALLKWQGTPMTVDHTGSSSCSASHVITFMELFFYRCRGCRANHPMLESWQKGSFEEEEEEEEKSDILKLKHITINKEDTQPAVTMVIYPRMLR